VYGKNVLLSILPKKERPGLKPVLGFVIAQIGRPAQAPGGDPKDCFSAKSVPKEIGRDLLAICRVLYVTRKAEGAGVGELDNIERAGKAFATALSMGHCKPDTIGSRAAWQWSEQGPQLLGGALSNGDTGVAKLIANWGIEAQTVS
jgi:hypothetical protein